MFRELRRQDRVLTDEESCHILKKGKYGILSLYGENGYPYGIPIHYVWENKMIYFHCSQAKGHKIVGLQKNHKVSFTVVETEDGIKSKSVILFGKAISIPERKQFVLEKLIEKFVPERGWTKAKLGINSALDHMSVYQIEVTHLCGKWIDKPEQR